MQKDSGTKCCYIIEEANSGMMGKVLVLLSNHHYLYFPWKGVVRGHAGHGDMYWSGIPSSGGVATREAQDTSGPLSRVRLESDGGKEMHVSAALRWRSPRMQRALLANSQCKRQALAGQWYRCSEKLEAAPSQGIRVQHLPVNSTAGEAGDARNTTFARKVVLWVMEKNPPWAVPTHWAQRLRKARRLGWPLALRQGCSASSWEGKFGTQHYPSLTRLPAAEKHPVWEASLAF